MILVPESIIRESDQTKLTYIRNYFSGYYTVLYSHFFKYNIRSLMGITAVLNESTGL
jgi:restriction endonuclease